VIAKALCYITSGEQLLLFRQPDLPAQGVQVPGGSVEPGEAPAAAALREAREETGLSGLQLRDYLGSARYELKVDVGPPHLRHFFHLSFEGQALTTWSNPGSRRADGSVVRFELWWEPLRSERLRLDWEMDVYLAALRRKLGL